MFGISPTVCTRSTGRAWTSAPEQFNTVTHIDKAAWVEELVLHDEHFPATGLPPAQGAAGNQGTDRKAVGSLTRTDLT
jgi:hypothetical protein